jgi:solute carrier family 6 amino acid transporter-like protein 5/7/9/14
MGMEDMNGKHASVIPHTKDVFSLDELEAEVQKQLQLQRKTSLVSNTSRAKWGNKWQFLLSCVGLSVGIGNVWRSVYHSFIAFNCLLTCFLRFPYLAYENGGGAFLIPYLLMLMLAGKPMYFMELAMGQFGGGPLVFWKCSPMLKGVGVAMILGSATVAVYYNVVMSYALYYMAQSFQSELPWTRCDPEWASGTSCVVRSTNSTLSPGSKTSSQVFWERKVLDISSGIEDLGGIKWDLALCLVISWIIVIACLAKGVKTSGKVIYFAATFPYAILLSLLVAGLTQTGAWEGIKYFILPDWNKLWTIRVWQAAASQMFFSLGVAMGGLIMYSSYNDFKHDIFR